MATDFSATTLASISMVGRSEGAVKTLGGFRKDRHTVPDAANAVTNAFLAKLCDGELREEAETLFHNVRTALAYKRKDLSLDLSAGNATLTTRDFVWELAFALKDDEPARYRVTRTLHSLRNRALMHLDEFDGLWNRAFTTLVFSLVKGVAVEAVIDAVETLDGEDATGLAVTYRSDCSECMLTVPGVEAAVRCTGATLEAEFPRGASPRELLDSFSAIRGAFALTRDVTLGGLI